MTIKIRSAEYIKQWLKDNHYHSSDDPKYSGQLIPTIGVSKYPITWKISMFSECCGKEMEVGEITTDGFGNVVYKHCGFWLRMIYPEWCETIKSKLDQVLNDD